MSSKLAIGSTCRQFSLESKKGQFNFLQHCKDTLYRPSVFFFFGSAHYTPRLNKTHEGLDESQKKNIPMTPINIDYQSFVTHQVYGRPHIVNALLGQMYSKNATQSQNNQSAENLQKLIAQEISQYYKSWPWKTLTFDPTINKSPNLLPDTLPTPKVHLGFPDAFLLKTYSMALKSFSSIGSSVFGISPDSIETCEVISSLYNTRNCTLLSDSNFHVRENIFGIGGKPIIDLGKLTQSQKGNLNRFTCLSPFAPETAQQYLPDNILQIDARQSRVDGREVNSFHENRDAWEENQGTLLPFPKLIKDPSIASSSQSPSKSSPVVGFQRMSFVIVPTLDSQNSIVPYVYSISWRNWEPDVQVKSCLDVCQKLLQIYFQKRSIPRPLEFHKLFYQKVDQVHQKSLVYSKTG